MRNAIDCIAADLRAPLERDPAARGWLDVALSYPGFHAIVAHRLIHALYRTGLPILPRFLSHVNRFLTGIEIHPAARIGAGLFIDHGMGVVIGETSEIGENVTMYQGVTLGGTSLSHGKRHPTIGNNVTIGLNSAVLGAISVGDNSRVGAGSVVVKDVPANATVVGIPARVVFQDGRPVHPVSQRPQVDMPDPTADLIAQLSARLSELERQLRILQRGTADGSNAEAI
ncbi:MAG: serine O-acetyltransferase [Candidatus Meridianibacter frigidus]|nr:MAG: serine O-acetyltransferase [Candidatus Eremiobacteraeota bacterium]